MSTINFVALSQQLKLEEIRARLKTGPASVEDIAALIGVMYHSVMPYLAHLRDQGQAHRPDFSKLWVSGPSMAWLAAMESGTDPAPPKVVRTDAASKSRNHVRRDPLVEALFGPAKAPQQEQ
jgi:predicted NAD/FAD-dependent oxidoreductase